jgi:hypothetical protein
MSRGVARSESAAPRINLAVKNRGMHPTWITGSGDVESPQESTHRTSWTLRACPAKVSATFTATNPARRQSSTFRGSATRP